MTELASSLPAHRILVVDDVEPDRELLLLEAQDGKCASKDAKPPKANRRAPYPMSRHRRRINHSNARIRLDIDG